MVSTGIKSTELSVKPVLFIGRIVKRFFSQYLDSIA